MKIWPFYRKKALTDEQILEMLGQGAPTATGVAVSTEIALRVPAVATAVRTISEAAASLNVKVVEIAADGSEKEVPGHPAVDLLRSEANEWTSGFEFIRSIMVDALCRDQGGLARVSRSMDGRPLELIRYRPGFINVDYPDDTLQPRYRVNGILQDASEIIHLRGTYDKSPLTLCREAIGVAIVMERHAARLFGRGARPGGVLRTKKPLGDKGAQSMIAMWRQMMDGADNSGKTAILYDDAEWVQMQLSSVDAQFQQLRLFQLQEIARAFNLPATLLGDLTKATWSNSAEMHRQFLQLCLEPWLRALEGALRRALFTKDQRKTLAIRFDRDDFTNVDLTARATAISSLRSSMVLTRNEARDWLDLPPVDDGNTFENPNTGSSQPGSTPASGGRPVQPPLADEQENEDENGSE
ncbi:phage portal protein [Falsochrobactrum sp. TDYN1]|uniref:Phage portal protein n=1 Tax=Falsochrobactrum tianjinense TaxID=2706015 RepID=A0A949UVU8_9HYPH|nr:phage portal protein [Falsochrobactrum sp. TDYN1]MBV2144418.1 phage portal protein [Falsochrobactrum sp. TDYN1]